LIAQKAGSKKLLGNKMDIPNRHIDYDDVISFANANNILFSEVSAKTGENINKIFTEVASVLANKTQHQDNRPKPFTIRSANKIGILNGCC